MEIEVSENITRKVHLTERQMDLIATSYLRRMLRPGEYIRDDNGKRMLVRDDFMGHGSPVTRFVREATELDEAVYKVLRAMPKMGISTS